MPPRWSWTAAISESEMMASAIESRNGATPYALARISVASSGVMVAAYPEAFFDTGRTILGPRVAASPVEVHHHRRPARNRRRVEVSAGEPRAGRGVVAMCPSGPAPSEETGGIEITTGTGAGPGRADAGPCARRPAAGQALDCKAPSTRGPCSARIIGSRLTGCNDPETGGAKRFPAPARAADDSGSKDGAQFGWRKPPCLRQPNSPHWPRPRRAELLVGVTSPRRILSRRPLRRQCSRRRCRACTPAPPDGAPSAGQAGAPRARAPGTEGNLEG